MCSLQARACASHRCVVSSCGAVGVCCLYGMRPLAERFHDTQLMVWGVLVMVASCGLLVVSLLSPSGGAALVQVRAGGSQLNKARFLSRGREAERSDDRTERGSDQGTFTAP